MRSRHLRGISLIEILVMGTVFALVTTMVAEAMVKSYRFHRRIEGKIQSTRQASLAAQQIVRDLEAARNDRQVTTALSSPPAFFPTPLADADASQPLVIALRMPMNLPPPDEYKSEYVKVAYWHVASADGLGEIRRARYTYDLTTSSWVSRDGPAGKAIARGIRQFQISGVERSDGLRAVAFEIAAGEKGAPLAFTTVLTPPPVATP